MALTPEEERERRRKYAADAHARAKASPRPCETGCGNDAAPRRKLCYACKSAQYRETHNVTSYDAASRARAKSECIEAYGGKCACCGETEPMFMTLDHVNGGGKQHRKETFGQKGGNMWAWARRNGYPDMLRLLCFNCNFAEHWGGCPHKKTEQEAE